MASDDVRIDMQCPHCKQGYLPLLPITPTLRQCFKCLRVVWKGLTVK